MPHLPRIPPTPKTGNEPFQSRSDGRARDLPFTVLDFWRWSGSDLLNNRQRGVLAEFLVAQAVGAADGVREEWDAKDLVTPDGLEIEVKSAAYLQSWAQDDYSTIQFDIAPRKGWDAETNTSAAEPARRADVYVFCLLAEKDPERVDPLDLDQWRFWVVDRRRLDLELGEQGSLGLGTLTLLAGQPVLFGELEERVRGANE